MASSEKLGLPLSKLRKNPICDASLAQDIAATRLHGVHLKTRSIGRSTILVKVASANISLPH